MNSHLPHETYGDTSETTSGKRLLSGADDEREQPLRKRRQTPSRRNLNQLLSNFNALSEFVSKT
jgi:hypothetical protein